MSHLLIQTLIQLEFSNEADYIRREHLERLEATSDTLLSGMIMSLFDWEESPFPEPQWMKIHDILCDLDQTRADHPKLDWQPVYIQRHFNSDRVAKNKWHQLFKQASVHYMKDEDGYVLKLIDDNDCHMQPSMHSHSTTWTWPKEDLKAIRKTHNISKVAIKMSNTHRGTLEQNATHMLYVGKLGDIPNATPDKYYKIKGRTSTDATITLDNGKPWMAGFNNTVWQPSDLPPDYKEPQPETPLPNYLICKTEDCGGFTKGRFYTLHHITDGHPFVTDNDGSNHDIDFLKYIIRDTNNGEHEVLWHAGYGTYMQDILPETLSDPLVDPLASLPAEILDPDEFFVKRITQPSGTWCQKDFIYIAKNDANDWLVRDDDTDLIRIHPKDQKTGWLIMPSSTKPETWPELHIRHGDGHKSKSPTPTKGTTKMNKLTITTPTLINGQNVEQMDKDELIHMIKNVEKAIESLEQVKVTSKAIAKIIKEHHATIAKLVKLLDAKS